MECKHDILWGESMNASIALLMRSPFFSLPFTLPWYFKKSKQQQCLYPLVSSVPITEVDRSRPPPPPVGERSCGEEGIWWNRAAREVLLMISKLNTYTLIMFLSYPPNAKQIYDYYITHVHNMYDKWIAYKVTSIFLLIFWYITSKKFIFCMESK